MDDNQQDYAEDSVARIIGLLKTTFGDYFQTYYQAYPSTPPPSSAYPLIIVQKLGGKAVVGPTTADEVTEDILITVMLNKADDAGSLNVRTTTMRHLQNIVEAQDPATNDYKSDTVLYTLRTYLSLTKNWLINSDATIKYYHTPQKDAPTLAIADVTLSTWRRVIVPNRT